LDGKERSEPPMTPMNTDLDGERIASRSVPIGVIGG
jgi:hypothetical protein